MSRAISCYPRFVCLRLGLFFSLASLASLALCQKIYFFHFRFKLHRLFVLHKGLLSFSQAGGGAQAFLDLRFQ